MTVNPNNAIYAKIVNEEVEVSPTNPLPVEVISGGGGGTTGGALETTLQDVSSKLDTLITSNAQIEIAVEGTSPVSTYPYPVEPVSGVVSTAMTATTSTAVTGMGAPGASKYNYITQITVCNTHATVGTNIELQDGSGGSTFYIIPAAAVYGGATISFPTPLKQPTVNTALYVKNSTTGASTFVSVTGFKAA